MKKEEVAENKKRNIHFESLVVNLVTDITNIDCTIDDLEKTPFYKQQLKRKGNIFLKEIKSTIDDYFDNVGEDPQTKLQFAQNMDARNIFIKSVAYGLSFDEQSDVSSFVEKLRQNKDVKGLDLNASSNANDIIGESSTEMVVTLTAKAINNIKKDESLSEDESRRKHRSDVFSKAKSLAGDDYIYKTHVLLENSNLMITYSKKDEQPKK